jgi:hypothetical protein
LKGKKRQSSRRIPVDKVFGPIMVAGYIVFLKREIWIIDRNNFAIIPKGNDYSRTTLQLRPCLVPKRFRILVL